MQRCGLCSLLAGLLRRAMCLGSRRGSAESYYQELADTADNVGADVTAGETPDSSCLRMANNVSPIASPPRSPVSPTSRGLLRSLGDGADDVTRSAAAATAGSGSDAAAAVGARRGVCFARGRFLTMHKRRRKRLTTRSLQQDAAILDDVLHGQAQRILDQSSNWRFNAFTLEVVTGGRSLPMLCVHLFHWHGLLARFGLCPARLWKLFSLIEEGYHSTNPYHNSVHAADVTQAMHCFLLQDQIRENLQPLEIMAALIGAVAHDLDHPGVNQPFLIATSNHLAALYENTSVLENHHWRSAIGCLLESGVAEQVAAHRQELEQQISSLILATDITRQQEFIGRFKEYLDTGSLDMRNAADRHFILQISLKCADISNPCRPWDVSKKWSQKVCEEFFRQGDYERQLGLPVTTLCDRHSTSMSKIQVGFYRFVVTPLFDEWHRFLDTALSRQMMRNLRSNQRRWEALIAQETAEETRTEISEAELIDPDAELDIGSSSPLPSSAACSRTPHRLSLRSEQHDLQQEQEEQDEHEERGSEENLLPELPTLKLSPTIRVQADGRRYSVPISIVTQPPPHGGHGIGAGGKRRESMPAEHIVPRSVADWDSSLSLLTSTSSAESHVGGLSAAGNSGPSERPLSAENLLPEPSIASMTSVNADRLSCVLQHNIGGAAGGAGGAQAGAGSRHLIRQQTFPPLQPAACSRTRYMSTAADLSGGRGRYVLPEGSSRSSSSSDSLKAVTPAAVTPITSAPSSGTAAAQRSTCAAAQKENVDPALRRGLSKRRGSAPAPMQVHEEGLATTPAAAGKHAEIVRSVHRRGSVPAAIIKLRSFEVDPHLYVDPEWSTPSNRSAPTSCCSSEHGVPSLGGGGVAQQHAQQQSSKRRSSVPCEAPAKVRADHQTGTTDPPRTTTAPLRSNGNKTNGAAAQQQHQRHHHRRLSLTTSTTTAPADEQLLSPGNGDGGSGGAGGGTRRQRGRQADGGAANGGAQQLQHHRRRGSLPADVVTLGSIRR